MIVAILVLVAVAYLLLVSIKIIPAGERAVVFRLGRLIPIAKGPGLVLIPRLIDRAVRVPIVDQDIEVPAQDVTMRDEMTRSIGARVTFRVLDPIKAVAEVSDYRDAVARLAQTAVRASCRNVAADEVGEKAGAIGDAVRQEMNGTASTWGVQVESVSIG